MERRILISREKSKTNIMKRHLQFLILSLLTVVSGFGQIPTTGLMAWYPFIGNANDMSGNGNNGTVNGATLTSDRFGNVNSAYNFNGTNTYISVPNVASQGNAARTIVCWVNSNYLGPQGAISTGSAATCQAFNLVTSYQNNIGIPGLMGYDVSCDYFPSTGTSATNGVWKFLSITYDMNSNIKIYVNGILDNSGNLGHNTTGQENFIGRSNDLILYPNYWNGKIDDIRFYNRALTQSEITALYNESSSSIITTTANPLSGGNTTGGGTYQNGTQISVVATQNSGWTFTNWTENGSVVSTSSSYTFVVSGNRNLVANFSQSQAIIVTSPNGFETLQVGTTHNISWTSSGINNVKIEYSYDNGTNWALIVNGWSASIGSYSWIVPNTPSTQCKVKISDANNPSLYDISDNPFTITSGASSTILVLSPNGGEIWQVGSNYNIAWTSTGVSFVNIDYSINNGSSWSTIVTNSPSAGNSNYQWTVPNTPSNQCKVRITDVANPSILDQSDNVFTILGSGSTAITVISPNGNEIWQVGLPYYVIWNSNNVTNIRIDYSIDDGFSWIPVVYSTPANTGNYSWIIPNTPSPDCKVKISDVANPAFFDESDSKFIISPITGIDDKESQFKIFPNPTTGIIKIQSQQPIEKVMVYNSMGLILKEFQPVEGIIDLSDQQKGIYFIRITTSDKSVTKKIVVI